MMLPACSLGPKSGSGADLTIWWPDAGSVTPWIGRASTYMGMERPAMSRRYKGGANMRSSGVRAAALAALISMARPPRPSSAEAETCSVVRTIAWGGRFIPRSSDRVPNGLSTNPG